MLFATIGALAALAAAQPGERWVETVRDADRTESLDVGSIEWSGIRRTAWTRTVYSSPMDGTVTTDLYRNEYDCSARTFTLIAFRRLDAAGREIESGTIPLGEREPEPVMPNTIAADEILIICGERPGNVPPVT